MNYPPVSGENPLLTRAFARVLLRLSEVLGTMLMIVFSFTLTPAVGVIGLFLLCFQALDKKCYNLILLNFISIIGLLFNIFY